jgi:hypothetical protein
MPLQKITLKSGVNRENTRYTNEGGWYDCDKIRFRQGTPEKIGGWAPASTIGAYFKGVCRSLWQWTSLAGRKFLGTGTNIKYYILLAPDGGYYDITPIRLTTAPGDVTFAATSGQVSITVTDTAHGAIQYDFVTFSGAVTLGGAITAVVLNQEYQITSIINANSYTFDATVPATAGDIGAGGGGTVGAYQVNVGPAAQVPLFGWGAGPWGFGPWGIGAPGTATMRVWNAQNFGQDLIYGPMYGPLYYWYATNSNPLIEPLDVRGVALSSLGGAVTLPYVAAQPVLMGLSNYFTEGTPVKLGVNTGGAFPTGINGTTTYYLANVDTNALACNLSTTPGGTALVIPTGAGAGTFYIADLLDVPRQQILTLVSDVSRFVICFGTNDYYSTTPDPMLIRWSEQESAIDWTSSVTNQAGSIRLSHGSTIVAAIQTKQEILVWTDTSLYSFQYVGTPFVWVPRLLSDNVTIASDRAFATGAGITYWMGQDKFYAYDGRVNTMVCDLRQFIFDGVDPGFNANQIQQVFAATVEKFNEIWWFYCSALTDPLVDPLLDPIASPKIDRYVVYNYVEKIWYYGTMARSAWIDAGIISHYPISAKVPDAANPNATSSSSVLLYQEIGTNDNTTNNNIPIVSYITSAEFDLDDGHNFSFVWRMLPDITFRGSTAANPAVNMYLLPLTNSGSGYNNNTSTNSNQSVASQSSAAITRTAVYPVEQFTGQIYTRVRGRQMSIKVESTAAGVQWQLGAPRLDIRRDGRR